jgi:hypothetical protein
MRTISLTSAKNELEALLGTRIDRLDPDAVDASVPDLVWQRLSGDGSSDIGVAAAIEFRVDGGRDEEVYVVTDVSFGDGPGAFVVRFSELASFYEAYLERVGERVFSGCDVIVWAPETRRLWVVQHGGVFAKAILQEGDRRA